MNRLLLAFFFSLFALSGYSQSGQDFLKFGNEALSNKNNVQIYPNPSIDFVHVMIENSDLQNATIVVHNIIGNEFKIETEEINKNEYRIDVRQFPSGYYLISVKDPATNFSETYKFLKR